MTWQTPEFVAQQLGGAKKVANGWMARCLCHDDKTPSLSISARDDGALLVKCHAGCPQDDIIAELKARDLWWQPDPSGPGATSRPKAEGAIAPVPDYVPTPDFRKFRGGATPEAVYSYRNADGKRLSYVCRYPGKIFTPISFWEAGKGTEWRAMASPKPRPLYGLDRLAREPEIPVLIVEGEKAADAAQKAFPDFVVVTWPNGANSVTAADFSPLAGREITIWPDNDDPGKRAALEVAAQVQAAGATKVKVVELPAGLPPKFDLADPIPQGLDIRTLLEGAREAETTYVRHIMSARELRYLDIAPREYLIDPFLPYGGLAMVYARRGLGKTWFGLILSLALARTEPFLGFKVPRQQHVLYIDGEMPNWRLQERIQKLGGPDTEHLSFLTSDTLGQAEQHLNINNVECQKRILEALDRLDQLGRRPAVIILDNLSTLGGGIDENDNTAQDGQLRWLTMLRHKGYAVVLIHHAGKNGDQRGASRREDILDTVIRLEAVPGAGENVSGTTFDMEFTKTRGSAPDPMRLRVALRDDDAGNLSFQYSGAITVPPYMRTLRVIYNGVLELGGIRGYRRQQELADALKLHKSAVSKHMKELHAHGYVVVGGDCLMVTREGEAAVLKAFGGEPLVGALHILDMPI